MGSRQETRGGTGYRRRPRSVAARAPHRADRSTLGLYLHSQSTQGHPTATEGRHDGASPSCVNGRSRRCSTNSLPFDTETGKIRIFKEE
jgi:hypothetical protein